MAEQNDRPKLYAFPGGASQGNQSGRTPVWASNRLYRCQKCGNTRVFYGRTTVRATIAVTAVRPFQYDIAEYTIDENDNSDHVVNVCGVCGSGDVVMYEVDLNTPQTDWGEVMLTPPEGAARIRVYSSGIDPLPVHEKDVVIGPDGRWYIGCERADAHVRMEQYAASNHVEKSPSQVLEELRSAPEPPLEELGPDDDI